MEKQLRGIEHRTSTGITLTGALLEQVWSIKVQTKAKEESDECLTFNE